MNKTDLEKRLEDLTIRHRELDNMIEHLYNKHIPSIELRALKVQKLRYKDQIEAIKIKIGKQNET